MAIQEETANRLANYYGFKNHTSIHSYAKRNPHLCPAKKYEPASPATTAAAAAPEEPIEAIFIFESPGDWGEALQVCVCSLYVFSTIVKCTSLSFTSCLHQGSHILSKHVHHFRYLDASSSFRNEVARFCWISCVRQVRQAGSTRAWSSPSRCFAGLQTSILEQRTASHA